MLELWEAFDLVQKVLLCMAVPATLLLVVELVLMLVGLAHGAGDADVSPDAGSAWPIRSPATWPSSFRARCAIRASVW